MKDSGHDKRAGEPGKNREAAGAASLMAVVQMAMLGGLPYTALRDAILTHPTMAEGLNSLFSSLKRANAGAASPDANLLKGAARAGIR